MKPILRNFFAYLLVLCPFVATSQILTPVTWQIALSETNVKVGEEIEIIFKATVDDVWYLYANDFDPDCGPLLTEVTFATTNNFQPVGGLKAINPMRKDYPG